MSFTSWPEIESFHNVRKHMKAYPDLLKGDSLVVYRPKVKLHGTNAGVRCYPDGRVVAQSRSKDLTVDDDNAGFAKWVASNEGRFRRLAERNIVIFGEWCGKGIQKGVAISQVDRVFAVFAAKYMETDTLVIEPNDLAMMVSGIPGVHVLPWFGQTTLCKFPIYWLCEPESLQQIASIINGRVEEVEAEDPWVKETFGVSGTGEGLVFYPVSPSHLGFENFTNLCFKAKGEKHKNVATAKPAQLDAETASSAEAFAEMVVTEARLMQGAQMGDSCLYDMKHIGTFIQWILADVKKETQDELDASGLTFKQVTKAVTDRARRWYIEKSNAA